MSNKQFRDTVRILHIIEGVMIILLIYVDALASNALYSSTVKYIVIPAERQRITHVAAGTRAEVGSITAW